MARGNDPGEPPEGDVTIQSQQKQQQNVQKPSNQQEQLDKKKQQLQNSLVMQTVVGGDSAVGPGISSDSNILSNKEAPPQMSGVQIHMTTIQPLLDIKIKNESSMSPTKIKTDIKPVAQESLFSSSSASDNKKKHIFNSEELKQALMPTLGKLMRQDPESVPFLAPVYLDELGICKKYNKKCLDYINIIKKPMDLSTIKHNLETDEYSDPWKFIFDVWLMFENAWLYNGKTSNIYKYCTKLSEVFEQEITPVMQKLGYCCGKKYTFTPAIIYCNGKEDCKISTDAKYFHYENRYYFCQKCFNDISEDIVILGDDPVPSQTQIKKDQFIEMKTHLELEPFVDCNECGRKQHQICVLYSENIWPGGFVCDYCMKTKGTKPKENKFSAKRLPNTKLGISIETRVNDFLKMKEAGAGEVHIRVVSSSDKIAEVKPGMRRRFVESNELCGEFPYRAKALFAFEDVDGIDVCFFGMYVQEYGSECPTPNTRRVYIAYLDSVHFFNPGQYRTDVYYEIILGYMDYVKQLGFTMAHIWACPPSEGVDFIFNCHPPDQKIPDQKRLEEWYKKMLDKGMIERIIKDYKDILKQAMEDKLNSAADLSYFEGDYWPKYLEETIKNLEKEEEKEKKLTGRIKINKNDIEERLKDVLRKKMFEEMEVYKEAFFVIRLHSPESAANLPPIQDPDPLIKCPFFDRRNVFLNFARDHNYEFSSFRRAKFSTLNMSYKSHTSSVIHND